MSPMQIASSRQPTAISRREAVRKIYRVSEIIRDAKLLLQRTYQRIWVEGEISEFEVSQHGHGYLTLKDAEASLKGIIFRSRLAQLRFTVTTGLQVICRGSLDIYPPSGKFQLTVEDVEPKGWGALQLAFEQLKERLAKEGLFDPAHKRPLPLVPQRIGIVTSPTGAAIHDMLQILKRRFAGLHILINPVRVQGEGAALEIARAIHEFNLLHARLPLDVLIVGRGGGSPEDLWAFNEEVVARAIYASTIPVMSAVGHEVDYTIADFVADVRAKTPSEAAELVVATQQDLLDRVALARDQLQAAIHERLNELRQRLEFLQAHYVFRQPTQALEQFQQQVDEALRRVHQALGHQVTLRRQLITGLVGRLHALSPQQQMLRLSLRLQHVQQTMTTALQHHVQQWHALIGKLAGRLDALSPVAILARGYSLTFLETTQELLRSVRSARVGDRLRTRLAQGSLISRVEQIDHVGEGQHE